jgi:hypothetical protein
VKTAVLLVAAGTAHAATRRALAVDDLFQMRDVGDAQIAPAGDWYDAHLKGPHG